MPRSSAKPRKLELLKFPYYKPQGHDTDAGMYRVGPLARLNVARQATTPLAELELRALPPLGEAGGPVWGSFYYHQARLIELLFCLESMAALLDDPELLDTHVRSHARTNNRSGIGVVERAAACCSTNIAWMTMAC